MVEVKRGRGRPRKNPIGVFRFDEPTKKKPVTKKAKKVGRPKGSKNKVNSYSVSDRLDRLEISMLLLAEIYKTLRDLVIEKKTK
jgi:hypothetical protein